MFSNYVLKLSAFIAGVVMLASSWLASAQEPTDQSSSIICGDTVSINEDADPLYRSLAKAAGQSPRWNFHKYLIDREGMLAGSYDSAVEPRSNTVVKAIERLL
jgi:hypothetical protein